MTQQFQFILSWIQDIFVSFGPEVILTVLAVTVLWYLLGR